VEKVNYKLVVSYDGTRYRGWQRLLEAESTIQGRLENVLSRIFDEVIEINGSGRTDAGVHAYGQVANFYAPKQSTEKVLALLRTYLPEDIGALSLSYAQPRFHARLSATGKTYQYRIWNSEEPDVFERKYRVAIKQKLNLEEMKAGAREFLGTHDFQAYCSNKHYKKSTERTIRELKVEKLGDEICLTISADGFLYNMARIMAGTLVEIGLGKRTVASIQEVFDSGKRDGAGETAPAKGLVLKEVYYD